MLHRVAVDLKMDALFFQLSVFHLFNKIMSDPAAAAYKVQKKKKKKLSLLISAAADIKLKIVQSLTLLFSFTGISDLCQVCAEQILFTDCTKQQGIC